MSIPRKSLATPIAVLVLGALLSAGSVGVGWAEATARFTAVVGGVTYQAGAQGGWQGARAGTSLASGSRIRTDRRGKCEIKFPGGSLVRMPSRADLVLTSVTQNRVRLLSGQVLTNAVKGSGVRIEGATATASVQGTWVLFNGEDMSVWDGTATLETPAGKQQVGDQQHAAVTDTQVALVGADDKAYGDVTVALTASQLTVTFHTTAPWALERTAVAVSTSPPEQFDLAAPKYDHPHVAATTDDHVIPLADLQVAESEALYLVAYALLANEEPSVDKVAAWGEGEAIASGGMYFVYAPAATGSEYPWEFPTGAAKPWWYGMQPGVSTVATPGTSIGMEMRDDRFSSYDALRRTMFGAPPHGRLEVGVESLGAAPAAASAGPGAMPLIWALSAAAAEEPTGTRRLGKHFFGPRNQLDLYGLLVSGGGLAGGRARMAGVYGPVYMELGGELSTAFDGEWDADVSEAFAVWRHDNLDLIAGRQHYLEGPVNNGPLGSQFAYLSLDGIRARYQGRGFALDGVWIDKYERGLVEPGDGAGWLGRLSAPVLGGQVAVNVLKEHGADTGLSLDFSLPAAPGYLDVYGEFGQDPWDQHFETWGLYSPWLFDRSGVDLFVEYARRDGYPHSISAMAYKDLAEDWYGLAGFREVEGEDCELSLGVAWRLGALAK